MTRFRKRFADHRDAEKAMIDVSRAIRTPVTSSTEQADGGEWIVRIEGQFTEAEMEELEADRWENYGR